VTILIVEDEPPIAAYIERCLRSLLQPKPCRIEAVHTLAEARTRLRGEPVDLCLLDLNLSGASGFDLLQEALARPLQVIVVSAHAEQAVTAFDYGVIDFVPKPFTPERLQKALQRARARRPGPPRAKYVVHRLGGENRLLPVEEIAYFQASRILVEARLADGRKVLLEKHLNQLERILPDYFLRIHRSFIVNVRHVDHFGHEPGAGQRMRLKDGTTLPISRTRYKALRKLFNR
jgi:DNA-binding LytR/AlgR family response regulator